jgi:carbonic anhydrase/acetyltransferase-like protein (isoleucine patch superfamily)
MILEFAGKNPVIGANVFIAPTAVVIGDVALGDNCSVWFNTVIRGDLAPITIGADTNIQDNATLHADPGIPLTIGAGVTVGHNAVIHGCTIEDDVLIGMQAVVMNGAVICAASIVAAGAVVMEGRRIGPRQLAAGMPAQVKRELAADTGALIAMAADHYKELARVYNASNFMDSGAVQKGES